MALNSIEGTKVNKNQAAKIKIYHYQSVKKAEYFQVQNKTTKDNYISFAKYSFKNCLETFSLPP